MTVLCLFPGNRFCPQEVSGPGAGWGEWWEGALRNHRWEGVWAAVGDDELGCSDHKGSGKSPGMLWGWALGVVLN